MQAVKLSSVLTSLDLQQFYLLNVYTKYSTRCILSKELVEFADNKLTNSQLINLQGNYTLLTPISIVIRSNKCHYIVSTFMCIYYWCNTFVSRIACIVVNIKHTLQAQCQLFCNFATYMRLRYKIVSIKPFQTGEQMMKEIEDYVAAQTTPKSVKSWLYLALHMNEQPSSSLKHSGRNPQ